MDNLFVLLGKVCPYCNRKPEYVDSSVVYGRSYGMIYICKPCNAYVGVHKGTDRPLGRLANKELRDAKKEAHFYFDKLWEKESKNGKSRSENRKSAYKWLSKELNIDYEYAHIGMFNLGMCKRVVALCRPYFKKGENE
jgi:hypothetical protein